MMLDLIGITQSAPSSGWNAPETLVPNVGGLQLEAAVNRDGRTEIFAIGEEFQLYHTWQTTPGGSYSAYTPFAGVTARQIALGQNQDGRLEIFYVGTDHSIWHNWENTPSNGPWDGAQLPGQAKWMTLTQNADGRLELFFIGMDDYIYHAWQNSPNATEWSQAKYPEQAIRIAAALGADGRLQVAYTALSTNPLQSTTVFSMQQNRPGSTDLSASIGLRAFAEDLTFLKRADGMLELFCIADDHRIVKIPKTGPNGAWEPPQIFGGSAQQIRFCQDPDGRYEMFYVGMDGYVYHLWQSSVNGPWAGGGRVGSMMANFLAPVLGFGNDISLFGLGYLNPPEQTVAAPYGGLAAWGNYCFYNNGRPLSGVAVEIDVTQDMVATSSKPDCGGFSIQLNGNGPTDAEMVWQQYVIEYDGSSVIASINNWKGSDPAGQPSVVPGAQKITDLSGGKIPAGYKLRIQLEHGVSENVMGAIFSVWDNTGKQLGSIQVPLSSSAGFTPDEVGPLLAYQVVIVGCGNGAHASFSSGAGVIRYSTAAAAAVVSPDPDKGFPNDGNTLPPSVKFTLTDESANTTYTALPNSPTQSMVQLFGIAPEGTPRALPKGVEHRSHQVRAEALVTTP